MLKKEQNELVTRTDAGTPMGELFRRYWLPALLATELAEPDGPPVRMKLLGERLIAIRDSKGRLGAMDEFCAHRGVSLWFGRNEEGGIRCSYHGWKYDVTGQCVDVPSEPGGSCFAEKVKLKSYPMIERGGVIWIYMGPPELQPPPPEWEFATVPANQSFISKRLQESNWLQALEGGIDSSHVSFLHSGSLKTDPLIRGAKGNDYNLADLRPQFDVADIEGGLLIAVRRQAEDGKVYWRVTPWIMPSFTMVPPRGDHPVHGRYPGPHARDPDHDRPRHRAGAAQADGRGPGPGTGRHPAAGRGAERAAHSLGGDRAAREPAVPGGDARGPAGRAGQASRDGVR